MKMQCKKCGLEYTGKLPDVACIHGKPHEWHGVASEAPKTDLEAGIRAVFTPKPEVLTPGGTLMEALDEAAAKVAESQYRRSAEIVNNLLYRVDTSDVETFTARKAIKPGQLVFVREDVEPIGRKDDDGKTDWTLLPWDGLEPVVRVLSHGANKYGRDNWQHVSNVRYVRAAFRHLIDHFRTGGAPDKDTGESHLAHVVCCALFVLAKPGVR